MKKNIIYALITVVGLLWLTPLNAQSTKTLQGVVASQDGTPVSGVALYADAGNSYALSDKEGQYTLTVKGESDIVLIEKKGYNNLRISVNELSARNTLILEKSELMMGDDDKVVIPFGEIESRRITGSVYSVDVQEQFRIDRRSHFGAAIDGYVPGVFNAWNTFGNGNAIIVVDGIPRDVTNFNLYDVESMTVLKDPVSKLMYGAQAGQGVILVTTKRGKAHKRQMNINVESGISMPRMLPKYLNAADFMETVNQGYLNDGNDQRFSQNDIDKTREGNDPLMYPDEDYYSSTYMRDRVNYQNVNADFSGGNDNAQYYVNMGYYNGQGWMNLGENDRTNGFNVRGNVDYRISDNLKMTLDGLTVMGFNTSPDVLDVNDQGVITSDYWNKMQNSLPNSFPVLIPKELLQDEEMLNQARLVDDKYVLGGSSTYNRSLYGDMTQRGYRKEMHRIMQFNTGLEWDMSFITKGLKANAYLSFDFYNNFVATQNRDYAVYEPVILANQAGNDSLAIVKHGKDTYSNKESGQDKLAVFNRRLGTYGTLSYDNVFGDHAISALGLAYRDQRTVIDQTQDYKNIHFGLKANYMFQNKYVVDLAGTYQGSQKLDADNRWGFSPAAGLAWIMTEEDFLSNGPFDYLKLKGTYGILKNDNWDNYFLYQTAFSEVGGWFTYGNTNPGGQAIRNKPVEYNTLGGNYFTWQKRKELTLGFESLLLSEKLWIEGGYFYSESYDEMTKMTNTVPLHLGGIDVYNNFNANNIKGFEAGIKYKESFGDFKASIGANMIYAVSEVLKMDEPFYPENAQQRYRLGKSNNALWGLQSDGLYSEADFDESGNLKADLPQPTFGKVQPGDIKYLDITNDGVIDINDEDVIGNTMPTLQYAVNIELQYKKISFFVLGIGQTGKTAQRTGDYYRAYGDQVKYSDEMLKAYGPNNKDVNAEIPRISSTRSNHNFRNSDYWTYDESYFTLPTMQLTYEVGAVKGLFNSLSIYARGYNLISVGANIDKSDLVVDRAPKVKGGALGLVVTF